LNHPRAVAMRPYVISNSQQIKPVLRSSELTSRMAAGHTRTLHQAHIRITERLANAG